MENTRKIILDNLKIFPEFEYYFWLIQVIEEKREIEPDMSIESCKSLIEGISKTFLMKFEWENYPKDEYKDCPFVPLVKKAMNKMSSHIYIEDDFIKRTCTLLETIWEIRNTRWDISHGKQSPKTIASSPQFVKLAIHITDSIVVYLLELYFSIEFNKQIDYQDDELQEFNAFLDEENPLDTISFSRALFDQDNPAYMQRYDEYKYPQ